MSVNSVQSTSGIERVYPTSTTLTAPNQPNSQTESSRSTPANTGFSTENEAPLRFPWLSWQTRELDQASKQPSPYGAIPLLGKEIDQKV
jgi:hypothetical protein